MILNNPIIFLLVGECGAQSSDAIKKYFIGTDGVAFVNICEKAGQSPNSENEMGISLRSNGELSFDGNAREKLDSIVRFLKHYRYSNREDVNIYIIADNCDVKYLSKEFYAEFYEALCHAFLKHIFCDLFFLVQEQFIVTTPMSCLVSCVEEFQKETWIRFIFIISDVTNEGVLKVGREEIYHNIFDTIMLETSKEARLHSSSGPLYEQLEENAFALNSKLLTMGRVSLNQPEELKKRAIEYELSKNIGFQENKPLKKFTRPERVEINELGEKISNGLQPVRDGMQKIACYHVHLQQRLRGQSKEDVLYYFFQNNHKNYIKNNKEICYSVALKLKRTFWEVFLEPRLDGLLLQLLNDSINIEVFDYLTEIVIKEIDNKIKEYDEQYIQTKTDLMKWNTDACLDLFGMKRIIFRFSCWSLLDEWWNYAYDLIFCDIMHECLNSIRSDIFKWKQQKQLDLQKIIDFQEDTQHRWDIILKSCNNIERRMLEVYVENVSDYLSKHNNILKKYLRQLYEGILQNGEGGKNIGQLTEQYVSSLYIGELKDIRFDAGYEMGNCYLKDDLYKNLYDDIISDKVIQLRGWFANIEPYTCLMGSERNRFVQFVQSQKDQSAILYFTEKYNQPVVMYYQHIEKTENLFLYKKREIGEDIYDLGD